MFQNQLKRLFSNTKNPNHAKIYFNPFHVIDHFWYPLKTSEVFWCFQGVSKEISGMKWVNVKGRLLKNIYDYF